MPEFDRGFDCIKLERFFLEMKSIFLLRNKSWIGIC